jgi:hypothetical protein
MPKSQRPTRVVVAHPPPISKKGWKRSRYPGDYTFEQYRVYTLSVWTTALEDAEAAVGFNPAGGEERPGYVFSLACLLFEVRVLPLRDIILA